MWSLPDIKRLNSLNSEAQLNRKRLEEAVRTGVLDGKTLRCCEYTKHCRGPLEHRLWYDIYSDGPRWIVSMCEFHRIRFGRPENFFTCFNCQRWMAKVYVYTLPFTITEDGWPVCLRCAAQRYVEKEDNWIALRDEDIAVVGFYAIQCAPHVLDACMPLAETVAEKIQLFDRVALDNETCGMIFGIGCQDPTPESAVEALREILEEAKNAGHDRALLIIDGVYEFAFSIGVYVRAAVMDPKQQANGGGSQ